MRPISLDEMRESKQESGDVYRLQVLEQVPRLLSLLDRHPGSTTYGCFDRTFWHYKMTDFAGVRFQEAALTLALLYRKGSGYPPYEGNPLLKRWVEAALHFWCQIQARDGSFSEWYPGEKSFVATAFSSYAVSEALLALDDEIQCQEGVEALARAGAWLLKHDEHDVLNQEAGAAAALQNLFLVTKDRQFERGARQKIDFLLRHQSEEGWFQEYGGPDIGYLSLTVDYLAKYFQKVQDPSLLPVLEKSLQFLSHFLHPNGTAGGEYGSRNTEYLIPHGIEILAPYSVVAARMAAFVREGLEKRTLIGLYDLDDRYLCYIAYPFLQAAETSGSLSLTGIEQLPCEVENFHRYFPSAQLLVHGDPEGYLVANLGKGGTFKWFSKKGNEVLYDAGIVAKSASGTSIAGVLDPKCRVEVHPNGFRVTGSCFHRKTHLLSTWKLFVLRIVGWLSSLRAPVAFPLKRFLRRLLIQNNRGKHFGFEREVRFVEAGSVWVRDRLEKRDSASSSVLLGEKFSDLHIPGARYFTPSELFSQARKGAQVTEGDGWREWVRHFEKGRPAEVFK